MAPFWWVFCGLSLYLLFLVLFYLVFNHPFYHQYMISRTPFNTVHVFLDHCRCWRLRQPSITSSRVVYMTETHVGDILYCNSIHLMCWLSCCLDFLAMDGLVCPFVCLYIVCCVLSNDCVLGLTHDAILYYFFSMADYVSSWHPLNQ